MFVLLCLSLYACVLYLCGRCLCLCIVCVRVIAFSHQIATKRGQVGTVPIYLLLIDLPPCPFSPHMWNTERFSYQPFRINFAALHPKVLGKWPWFPSLSSLFRKVTSCPNIGTFKPKKTILGTPPHSFQKTNIELLTCTIMNLHLISFHLQNH